MIYRVSDGGEGPTMSHPREAHAVWCETVGCGCLRPHHHHHDYIETLHAEDEASCEACREAERRKDDEWNRPYRWVYDWSPPCRCDAPDVLPDDVAVLRDDILHTGGYISPRQGRSALQAVADARRARSVGGRVVSEPVIEKMAEAMCRLEPPPLEPPYFGLDEYARAAARVLLEHMEDNEKETG